ncbi:hypothetical protein [Nocardioides sp.]|uniref:hypothetical protein n=1 Tax=Nocardioides sp. TaxID=35761 RepID=UPI0026342E16|nr:hypothetical protein [Nocardioides sp.]
MDRWREVAAGQAGVVTRRQLREVGVDADAVSHRVRTDRWAVLSPTVIATTTGPPSLEQQQWAAVLHGGEGARLAGISAAAHAGLKNWQRDEIAVLVPYRDQVPPRMQGVTYTRSRRDLVAMGSGESGVPRLRVEPAVLLFAAGDRSPRTAQGLLAAVVQQRLATPQGLLDWLDRLTPLRRAPLLREALTQMAGGAQSLAEIDLTRVCRRFGLPAPRRQVKRRDSEGQLRYTDSEWLLSDGRTLILEVDGLFHMDVDQWEADLARQRALSGAGRVVVRCTARELRDDPARLARDLRALGV